MIYKKCNIMQFFTIIRPVDVFTLAAYRKTGGMPGLAKQGAAKKRGNVVCLSSHD